MEPAMAVEGVTKRYGETVALDGVSLAVESGEVLALVGPNGAGKTTLVRVLTGTTAPEDGTASLLGGPPEDVDRNEIGVLPQAFAPPDRLTARELLRYYAGLYEDSSSPEAVLSTVGVADAADTRYGNLSGGQQRRVCLGTTLVNDPAVLVLDEPTTGIDPTGRRTVRTQIESLAARGRAVLVTTHDMDEAERIADRVALLADGTIRATGTPQELIEAHGGSARVRVEMAETGGGETETASAALRDRGFDAGVERDRLVVPDVAPAGIADVVDALETVGIEYEGIEWHQPSLEDAFVALAGDEEGGETAPISTEVREEEGSGGAES